MWAESTPGYVLGQLQGSGHSEARRNAEPVDSGGLFTTRKVGTNVNPADLMTKPPAKPKIEQLMGYESMGDDADSKEGRSTGT